MREIEKEMIEAIKAKKDFVSDNTTVWARVGKVLLHGNLIAKIDNNTLYLSDCGYKTKTTKSRLNCLLNHFNLPIIYSKNYQWYIGEELWLGNKTFDITSEEDKLRESLKYSAVLGEQSQQPRPYDAVLGGKK